MNYFHILTLMFVAAKLANLITWSWWLVLTPSLISIGIALFFLHIAGLAIGIANK